MDGAEWGEDMWARLPVVPAGSPPAPGSPADPCRLVPARVVALVVLQLLLLVVFAASTLLRHDHEFSALLDGWLGNIVLLLPGVVCLSRAHAMPGERRLFLLLGLGMVTYAAGNILFTGWLQFQDPVPYPSWSDALNGVAYTFLILGVGLAARSEVAGLQRSVWLDGLIGGLGAAAIGSALGLRAIVSVGRGDLANPASLAVNTAYPIADLLLVVFVVSVFALTKGRPAKHWRWLGAGLVCFAVADTAYLVRLAADSYVVGTPLDVLWGLGLTLMAVASLHPGSVGRPARPDGAAALVVPLGFSAGAVAVLGVASRIPMPSYVVALAVTTLLVALVRTAIGFQSIRVLLESRREARTDELTGLPNRRAFYEHLEQQLPDQVRNPPSRTPRGVGSQPGAARVGILLLDLDRFKEVNDSLGHHIGDELLRLVAGRLRALLRPGDVLARLGGDEFVVVLPDADASTAREIAHRLAEGLTGPFALDGVSLHVGASIGIAVSPEHGTDRHALLQRADVAMYEAKAARSRVSPSVELYQPRHDMHSRARLQTIEALRRALNHDGIAVHYQPKCNLGSGQVVGVEALVRWRHKQDLLQPDAFLPLVEQIGMMPALTLTVLEQAVAQCRQWHLNGLNLSVGVNLSAAGLVDDQLPDRIAGILTRHQITARALTLEITENSLLADPGHAAVTLHTLRELGISLSIDDYGTGYCSLSYLRDLPVDELKLDRSFVASLTRGSRDAAIVRSTIDLAHALDLRLVAEGVENATALAVLQDLGCDLAQGYHLCRPLPPDALTRWLNEHVPRSGQNPLDLPGRDCPREVVSGSTRRLPLAERASHGRDRGGRGLAPEDDDQEG